jgi:Zn-dependent peptidase ImmA (M78 family)/transcriptional regulator with XRE-family HTH domain
MAFGDRLRLARARAGLSLVALSERLDNRVSSQAINKYERGEMMPSSSVLVALSKALGVSLDFLMASQVVALDGVDFRKRASITARERALIEGEVIDHVERYLGVEEALDLGERGCDLDDQNATVITNISQAEDLANDLRGRWNLGNDPIPSMTALFEERGIRVIEIEAPETFSGLTCMVRRPNGKKSLRVVVHRHFNVERDRFTLGHELGHALIADLVNGNAERAMDRFAGAFLVPAQHLKEEIGHSRTVFGYEELIRLKHLYGVSMWCLIHRLKDVGIISEDRLNSLYRTPAKAWLKSEPDPLSEDGDIARLERPKRFDSLVYRALAEGLITSIKAAGLLKRPVSEVERAVKGPN